MDFARGDKVQAVDQNGHWSNAQVLDIVEGEKCTFLVRFTGWGPEYDLHVECQNIRSPVLPLEEQIRGKCIMISFKYMISYYNT